MESSSGSETSYPQNKLLLPTLPDEILEIIIQFLSPAQIVASQWFHLSNRFKYILDRHVKRCKYVNVCDDKDVLDCFQNVNNNDICSSPVHKRLLELLIVRLFSKVERLEIPISLFSNVLSLCESTNCELGLNNVKDFSLSIGEQFGSLSLTKNLDHLKAACSLFGSKPLRTINLDVIISDNEHVTLCGFRELVRFLQESSSGETIWNITLRDSTVLGQGWFGPTDLTKCRNKAFICYVRILLEQGVRINSLSLIDNFKPSPYMLIMASSKRRSIYMYPEYKNCKKLKIFYDIGLVAPVFAHENDRFARLEMVEVQESHVLYKSDLVAYLANAPSLKDIRVILPTSWNRRVSTCTYGCFKNPDFACFREDGWCLFHEKLGYARIVFV